MPGHNRLLLSIVILVPLLTVGCGDSSSSPSLPSSPDPEPKTVPLLDWGWLSSPQIIDTDSTNAGRPNGVLGTSGDASMVWRRDGTGSLSCGAMAYYDINTVS